MSDPFAGRIDARPQNQEKIVTGPAKLRPSLLRTAFMVLLAVGSSWNCAGGNANSTEVITLPEPLPPEVPPKPEWTGESAFFASFGDTTNVYGVGVYQFDTPQNGCWGKNWILNATIGRGLAQIARHLNGQQEPSTGGVQTSAEALLSDSRAVRAWYDGVKTLYVLVEAADPRKGPQAKVERLAPTTGDAPLVVMGQIRQAGAVAAFRAGRCDDPLQVDRACCGTYDGLCAETKRSSTRYLESGVVKCLCGTGAACRFDYVCDGEGRDGECRCNGPNCPCQLMAGRYNCAVGQYCTDGQVVTNGITVDGACTNEPFGDLVEDARNGIVPEKRQPRPRWRAPGEKEETELSSQGAKKLVSAATIFPFFGIDDAVASYSMKTTGSQGVSNARIRVVTLETEGTKLMKIELTQPAELLGTVLQMRIRDGAPPEMWLADRGAPAGFEITPAMAKYSFAGTAFTFEDFALAHQLSTSTSIIEEQQSKPHSCHGTTLPTQAGHTLICIDEKKNLVTEARMHDATGRIIHLINFNQTMRGADGLWKIRGLSVRDHQSRVRTELSLSSFSPNNGFLASDFNLVDPE